MVLDEDEQKEEEGAVPERVKQEVVAVTQDDCLMEIDIKKEREEGELEEGELPDAKMNNVMSSPKTAVDLVQLDNKVVKSFDFATSTDLSVPFTPTQIRQLFKLLPESSLMGAEVSRTFSQLCNKAMLHKKIY